MNRSYRHFVILFVLFSLVCVSPIEAFAARTAIHRAAESPVYREKFVGMIGRGVLNVLTSPVDVVVQTAKETQNGPPVVGTFTGLGRGLGCGVLRLGSGALDIVTFWVPSFNGIPVDYDFGNCANKDGDQANASGYYQEESHEQPAYTYEQPTYEAPTYKAPEPAPRATAPAQAAWDDEEPTQSRWKK